MEPTCLRSRPIRMLAMIFSILAVADAGALAADASSIARLNTITSISTTIPSDGDVNPYGVARVPLTKGSLVEGRFLISNFNNGMNQQGTGTTIVQIAPNGTFSLFAQIDPSKVACPGGVGLTTALVALRSGLVVVGSLPTMAGDPTTSQAGCLIVLDSNGKVLTTFSGHHINGPWDMTAVDGGRFAVLFVTNVLNDTVAAGGSVVNKGTVVRLLLGIPEEGAPALLDSTVIASGFPERTDPNALVIGPTGVAFDDLTGILYVADSLNNRITAIPAALFLTKSVGPGFTLSQGGALNDPLGLTLTRDHHLIAANGDDGNLVEVNAFNGKQVGVKLVDNTGGPPPGAGALFGLIAVHDGVYFVDDASNTFNLLH
jgi:DNA-binding beta-propeller fold protein YncE